MEFREVLFGFTVVLWTCAYFVGVLPVDEQNKNLELKIQEQMQLQSERNETIAQLQLELQRLQNKDPKAIEKVLREKYKYCRENETVGFTPRAKNQVNP